MKILKNFLLSLFFISFAFCVTLQIKVEDIPQGVVSGANVTLIGLGSGFSGTTDSQGIVLIENIPDHSVIMIKVSKTGYVNTYWGPWAISSSNADENGIVTESNAIISQSFYNNYLHAPPAPSHQAGKGDIAGMVSDGEEGVSGVVINAKYLDTNTPISSTQIKYFGDDMMPGNYTSTQSNGVFCIYNVDPGRPILITGTKSGYKFTQTIVISYSNSVTITGIEQIDNYILISGYVTELTVDGSNNRVSGANVSILGTNISDTTDQNGEFTLNNVPSDSLLITKVSKQDYKDFYFIGRSESQDLTDAELFTITTSLYTQILPIQHISGKGDILGGVGTSGVVVKLYDYQGNEVNLTGKVYYWDDTEKRFIQTNSTTSDGTFIILNLDPGVYFLRPIHDDIDFPSQCLSVFSDGLTYTEFEVNIPKLYVWAGDEIQVLPQYINRNAQNVEMLRFNLWKEEGSENIIVNSIKFTAKGTGNISNSVSSVKLYHNPFHSQNPNDWILLATGTINGNEITFNNLNLEIWETGNPAKYLSLVFNFNGNASHGQTFGVDILSNSDITGYGKDNNYSAKIEGAPIYGRLTTISQLLPPAKPQAFPPPDGISGLWYWLSSSEFDPAGGNTTHKASQWRIWKEGESYETLTWDSGEDQQHLTYIHTPIPLESYTRYYFQVRHENGDNIWSEWSEPAYFGTGEGGITPPYTPTNQEPIDGAQDIEIPVTLQASPFVPGSSNIHVASQWKIYRLIEAGGTVVVFDSKRDTTNLTSITISSLLPGTQYYWTVRYQDGNGAWSAWSVWTSFITKQVIKGDLNGDYEIDISDVILCLRMAIGLDQVNLETADMNGDNQVDISDVILVLRKAIGLPI